MGLDFGCDYKYIHMSYSRFASFRIELAKLMSPSFGANYEMVMNPLTYDDAFVRKCESAPLPKKVKCFFFRSDCSGHCPYTVSRYFYNLLGLCGATEIAGISVADLREIFQISYTTKQPVWWG